ELAHRDLDFHARVGIVSEHLRNAADRLRVLARLRHQLHGHDLPRLYAARLICGRGGRHHDVVRDAPVLGDEETNAMLLVEPAHDAPARALEHFHNLSGGSSTVIAAGDAHGSAIAMHELAHLRGRHEYRRPAVIRNEEAVAV